MTEQSKHSLTKNTIWYLINNVLNIGFPFATGIYVARVLMPESIGLVASAQNLASYFVIFAFLGIPTYGLREISKARFDKNELSKTHSELLIINLISTLVFSLAYFFIILFSQAYKEHFILYAVCGGLIVLNALNNSWLYEGLEKFSFISIRNIIFKALMFVLLLLFVRKDVDYILYASITVIGTAGNYILNFVFSHKYVSFTFKGLNLTKHLKSIFFLAAVNLAIEIYTLVDVTMLGIFSNEEHIAYYKYGASIGRILLQVINTFTIVLIPRITSLYKEGKKEEFNGLLTETLELIILIAVPMIIGIQFTSSYLICQIYGDVYITSSYVLNIISGILLISPVGYLLGSRTLLVAGKEKYMLIPVVCGAVTNVVGNLLLIPHYSEIGAAIASLIGEIVVTIVYLFLGRKYFKLNSIFKTILKISFSAIVMTVTLLTIVFLVKSPLVKCVLEISLAVIIYFTCLLILKEKHVFQIFCRIKRSLLSHGNK